MSAIIDLPLFASTFVILFVIIDPIGTLPVFLSLTSSMTKDVRRAAARTSTLVAFSVIAVFSVAGAPLLSALQISVPSLQLAGGLLLLLIALQLLAGDAEEPRPSASGASVALVPLATPLMAGPGAIVATMVAVENAGRSAPQLVAIALAVILIHLTMWVVLRFSDVLFRLLGTSGVTLVTRLSGMLLAAIAVEISATAIFAFIDGYLEG